MTSVMTERMKFEVRFSTKGKSAAECMDTTERMLVGMRTNAADVAKKRLMDRGYFSGSITTDVAMDGDDCVVTVMLVDVGEPALDGGA